MAIANIAFAEAATGGLKSAGALSGQIRKLVIRHAVKGARDKKLEPGRKRNQANDANQRGGPHDFVSTWPDLVVLVQIPGSDDSRDHAQQSP